MPFFPVEDALLVDFQVFGDLSEGDDKNQPSDGVTTPSDAMPDGKWNDLRSLKNAL